MDIIPVLGSNFNRIFPIFILVLAVLQSANIFNRLLLHFRLGFLQFGDIPVGAKDMDEVGKRHFDISVEIYYLIVVVVRP